MTTATPRLDAGESIFFKRQNEIIDKTVYEIQYPDNKGRTFVPPVDGVPDSAPVYTWRMYNKVGDAAIVANMADDIPRADAKGEEASQVIKTLASSYAWDVIEIKEAARTGAPLDAMKAAAARYQIERKIDELLATGASWCSGLLNLSNTTSYTLSNKSKGGKTWANGTSDEIAGDIFGIISNLVTTLKDSGGPAFHRFSIILPVSQYALIAQKRMGDASDMTVLKFVLQNSPYIESIDSWHRCAGAGSASADRMVCYPKNQMVLGGLVPMEYTPMAPEQKNLSYVVNAMARCGGVIARYPVAISYGDGL